jgi:hypothetical protein
MWIGPRPSFSEVMLAGIQSLFLGALVGGVIYGLLLLCPPDKVLASVALSAGVLVAAKLFKDGWW